MFNILFAGTSDIGVETLKSLYNSNFFRVVGVLTSLDKPRGRSLVFKPSPIKEEAINLNIPVFQFESLKTEARNEIKKLNADSMVCFSYGKIFGPKFLSLFKYGSFNIHPSDLPNLRGPAPIQYSILNQNKKSAISIQSIGLEMDSGDIWYKKYFDLNGTETFRSLTSFISKEVSTFFPDLLNDCLNGRIQPEKQKGEATYTSIISKTESLVDFNNDITEIHASIRAFYPNIKVYTELFGKKLFLCGVYGGFDYLSNPYKIESSDFTADRIGSPVIVSKERGIGFLCKDNNILFVNSLQSPGKKEMGFKDFLNGNKWLSSIILTQII